MVFFICFGFQVNANQSEFSKSDIVKMNSDTLYIIEKNKIKLVDGSILVRSKTFNNIIVNKRTVKFEGTILVKKRELDFVVYSLKGNSVVISNVGEVQIPEGFFNWFTTIPPYRTGLIQSWKSRKRLTASTDLDFSTDIYRSVVEEQLMKSVANRERQKSLEMKKRKESKFFNDLFINNYLSK